MKSVRRMGAKPLVRALCCLVMCAAVPLAGGLAVGQMPPGPPGSSRPDTLPPLPPGADMHPDGVRLLKDSMIQQDNQKKVAEENRVRQQQLADDTAKLLALATELKAEMDKTSKDTLNMNYVRKAEQIEKLAHQLRDKMKASLGN